MMAKPSAKKPGRGKLPPRPHHNRNHSHQHHHRSPDRGEADLGAELDEVSAVTEGAYAVSEAAAGGPPEEWFGEALRDAAEAVARAEARLAEIGDDLQDAAVYSDKLIQEAVELERQAIDHAAAAQAQAIAAAQEAIARAMAAASDIAGAADSGGVRPLPPGRRYGD